MLNRFLRNTTLSARLQAVLGAIFVAAAVPKIMEPPDFAHMIYNYDLAPGWIINAVAIYLPWLELICGLGLILGLAWRGATAVIGGLLVVFIALLSINLWRGHPVDCGCFDLHPRPKSRDEMFADMWMTILRDIGMLAMVGYIATVTRIRRHTD